MKTNNSLLKGMFVFLALVLFVLSAVGCKRASSLAEGVITSNTAERIVGGWEEEDNGDILVVYENAEFGSNALGHWEHYTISRNGKNITLFDTPDGEKREYNIAFPDYRHMTLTDFEGVVLNYKTANHDSNDRLITTSGSAAGMPDIVEIKPGEIGKFGNDSYFVRGWFWANDSCKISDQYFQGAFPVVDFYVYHSDNQRAVKIIEGSLRNSEGETFQARESDRYYDFYGSNSYCDQFIGNDSFLNGYIDSNGDYPVNVPFNEHYYIAGQVRIPDAPDWSTWNSIRMVLTLKHEDTSSIATFYLDEKPTTYPIPKEIDPLSRFASIDGSGPKVTARVDSISFDGGYKFELTLKNVSKGIVEVYGKVLVMDKLGSFHDGELEGTHSMAPGESMKVSGTAKFTYYPKVDGTEVLVLMLGQLDYFEPNPEEVDVLAVKLVDTNNKTSALTSTAPIPDSADSEPVISLPTSSATDSPELTDSIPVIDPNNPVITIYKGAELPKLTWVPVSRDREGLVVPFTPCSRSAMQSRIVVGDTVTDIQLGKVILYSRAKLDNYSAVAQAGLGSQLEVLEGPVCRDNLTWWKMKTLDTGFTGWTLESDVIDGYYIDPIPNLEEAGWEMTIAVSDLTPSQGE